MADQPENITLRYLRNIDEKLDCALDDLREIKQRTGTLEESHASVSRRVDRIDDRLNRIEKRLNLVDV